MKLFKPSFDLCHTANICHPPALLVPAPGVQVPVLGDGSPVGLPGPYWYWTALKLRLFLLVAALLQVRHCYLL